MTATDYMGRAFLMMNYPDPYDHNLIVAFKRHWGSFQPDALLRAVYEIPAPPVNADPTYPDEPEELVLAIFGIGYSEDARARQPLEALLRSPNVYVRWASALALGYQQDEQALPVLFTMLTEHLPPHLLYVRPGIPEWRNEMWRTEVPCVLARPWRQSSFVPPLHDALIRIRALLSGRPPEARAQLQTFNETVRETLEDGWRRYAKTIVFALGRIGAFGALADLGLSSDERLLWQVHLAMGAESIRQRELHFRYWDERPDLRAEVSALLAREYGLDATIIEQALERYEAAYLRDFDVSPALWADGWD